jgi:hypothetical protein
MNVRRLAAFTIFVLNAAIVSSLFAQGGRGGRFYNPSTEITVQGKVAAIDSVNGRRGWNGIHLTVESEGVKYDVHLGPAAYVERNGFTFAAGDQVEIVGSEVVYNGTKALIAREIEKGEKKLTLRDKQGFPLWSGGPPASR